MAKRGRPKGPATADVHVLLYEEQKELLAFLSKNLPGQPPITGLVREAVAQYITATFEENDRIAKAYEKAEKPIRIVK